MMDSPPTTDAAPHDTTDAGPARGENKNKAQSTGAPLLPPDSPLLKDLHVTLQARLGETVLPIAELLALRAGSVLSLETRMNEPVELYLNDALVGRGEIVAVDDRFGVRIVEIAAE